MQVEKAEISHRIVQSFIELDKSVFYKPSTVNNMEHVSVPWDMLLLHGT